MILKLGMKHHGDELYKVCIWRETCREYANGQKIYVYENSLSPGGCLPLPFGYINEYDHNIQASSPLKPLAAWPIKAKLYVEYR